MKSFTVSSGENVMKLRDTAEVIIHCFTNISVVFTEVTVKNDASLVL